MRRNYIICLFVALFATIGTKAQKKIISPDDFASWKVIQSAQISNDGRFTVYELNAQRGDGQLIVHNNSTQQNDTIKFGQGAKISANGLFMAYKLKQPFDTIRKAKLDKVEEANMPKDSLGVYFFNTGKRWSFPKLKSFKVASKGNDLLSFIHEVEIAKKDTADKTKETIKRLMIFDGKDTLSHDRVEEYYIPKYGEEVAFVIKSKRDSLDHSAVVRFSAKKQKLDTILSQHGFAKKLTATDHQEKLAFLFSADTIEEKTYALYLHHKNDLKKIVDIETKGIQAGFCPSENRSPYFSEDGTRLYLGVARQPKKAPKDTVTKDEIPGLDVWSWTDLQLQPMQKLNASKEKKRTYLSVYHIKQQQLVLLADSLYPEVRLLNKGKANSALVVDSRPYRRASSWSGKWHSAYYLIDQFSGEKKLIKKDISAIRITPDGNYAVWYEKKDSCFYVKNMANSQTFNLTQNLKVNFYNEWNDVPNDPSPYGFVGFDKSQRYAFINDRFDIWKFDLQQKKTPENITNGEGRKTKTRFDWVDLDYDEVLVDTKQVILQGFNEETKESGYFQSSFQKPTTPKALLYGPYRYRSLTKAKDAEAYIWRRENVQQFANLRFGKKIAGDQVISNANPQQKEYNWATNELVKWTSFKGEQLEGMLYKPEDFDPNKKYPMMVYFYERNADNLHRHYYPYPSYSTINRIHYTSNGYLVFVPDITYTVGQPGQDAYDAIISGVMNLVNTYSWVDKAHMALQGQSWGGYQTAHLITRTNLFAAAMAGAPVSNMTSAYGGIRWGSGMSRMFQYEHTQSRIGGTLWERTSDYIRNSPVFFAPRVETPLLMMHNDNDGAVPWYQGIEYFVALRRLNKPAWLLVYNGEPHNLRHGSWANRKDLSIRMKQFFDHYLKGAPAPKWMTEGIPAVNKGKDLGY
ncbi:S9 family peptidase [Prolixibacteraceae bacterium JC049]|nr:S9 family peptidase [Prolixibacteraceae bacterium JC049]